MDSAFQRRSHGNTSMSTNKTGGTSGGTVSSSSPSTVSTAIATGSQVSMTDSEKILLQLLLDVKAFALELQQLGLDLNTSKSYQELLSEVQVGNKMFSVS